MEVDFNRRSDEGQMTVDERKTLYSFIVDLNLKNGIEVGTWKGGGSTYIITSALKKTGGLLTTFEINEECYNFAKKLYATELNHLEQEVIFYNIEAGSSFLELFSKDSIDFILLDGSDDPFQTLYELGCANKVLRTGGLIFCHDFNEGKQCLTRLALQNENCYQPLFQSNESTGFAVFRKKEFV